MSQQLLITRMLNASGKTAGETRSNSEVGEIIRSVGIRETPEIQRIARIPRRDWSGLLADNYGAVLSNHLRRPGATCRLLDVQVAALTEFADYGGFLGNLGLGCGKCSLGDTELYDPTYGRRLAQDQGFFSVVASDGDGKFVTQRANGVSSGVKECVRVHLDDGSKVGLSLDHPVFTHRGWVPAGDLQPEDLVAVARTYPEPENPYEIPRDDLILCAYLLSNGGVTTGNTILTDDNLVLVRECLEVAERITGKAPTRKEDSGKSQQWSLLRLTTFRDKYGMHGLSKEKRVPAQFWRLSNENLRLFISRFWASDGWVSGQEIGLGLASEGLLDDIRFMLLRLGIRTRKRFKPVKLNGEVFDSWNIVVVRNDALEFFKQIDLPGMDERVNRAIELLQTKPRNTNVDVVPVGRPQIEQIARELGLQKWARGSLSRSRLRELSSAHGTQLLSRQKFMEFCDTIDYQGDLRWLTSNDFIWTYVKELEPIGEHPVYDLSVPEYHNFVGNHVLLHNTLITLLAPTLIGAERPLLLVPGSLRQKTINDSKRYRAEGWLVHPRIELVSYEQVSRNPELLLSIAPDAMFCDEVQALKNVKAGVTRRVAKYMKLHSATKFMGLSGTVSTRSLLEFWHLLMWALRPNLMPIPRNYGEAQEWALAVDEKIEEHARMAPGALITVLGKGIEVPSDTPEHLRELVHARMSVKRRLHETAGFMHTSQLSCDASASMEIIHPPKSAIIDNSIQELRAQLALSQEDEHGELLLRPADVWAKARMKAQGFDYEWSPPPPDEWRERRRYWHKLIRWALEAHGRTLDTPMDVAKAIDRGILDKPFDVSPDPEKPDPRLPKDILGAWRAIAPTYKYELIPHWFDESRVRWVAQKYLVDESEPWIVWVEHIAVGRKLAEISGRPFHHSKGIDQWGRHIESARGPIIASVDANHRGMNLQQYCRNFIMSAEPTGKTWEQLFGRTHRQGQLEDHVYYEILEACDEHRQGLAQVLAEAHYARQTLGTPQILLLADKVNL